MSIYIIAYFSKIGIFHADMHIQMLLMVLAECEYCSNGRICIA